MFNSHTYRLASILLAFLLFSTPAHAQVSRIYLAGYLGLNTYNDIDFVESRSNSIGTIKPSNNNNFAGALGLRLSETLRLEGELHYNNAKFDKYELSSGAVGDVNGEITSYIGLANLYYDFDVPWEIQPFIGAGIGYGFFEGNINDLSGLTADAVEDSRDFVYQIGGGAKYRMAPDLALTGSYRYLSTLDLKFGTYDMDYNNHEFRIGLEYDLPYD